MANETRARELQITDNLYVTVREMTVQQVRSLLQDAGQESERFDVVDNWLLPDVSMGDLKRMSTLTDEQIADMLPSQLRTVMEACRELNPDFFALVARLTKLSQATN